MVSYIVTVSVEKNISNEWLSWMIENHIPEVMATGCFTAFKINKKLFDSSDAKPTFIIQYACNKISDYEFYKEQYAKKLQEEHASKYKDQFTAFREIWEEV